MVQKTSLQEKLEAEVQETAWASLAPLHRKGRVLVVDPGLPVVMVGMAIARDCVHDVRGWLAAGRLSRPDDEQIAQWAESGQRLRFLIVQPYVLVSPSAPDA